MATLCKENVPNIRRAGSDNDRCHYSKLFPKALLYSQEQRVGSATIDSMQIPTFFSDVDISKYN